MEKKPLRQQVMAMEVGDVIVVSLEDYGYNTIRNYACDLGFALNRTYHATRDRATRSYTIKRLA